MNPTFTASLCTLVFLAAGAAFQQAGLKVNRLETERVYFH